MRSDLVLQQAVFTVTNKTKTVLHKKKNENPALVFREGQ